MAAPGTPSTGTPTALWCGLQVLIGQFTTTGELSGQVYCQVFINGNGQTEFRDTFFFGADAEVEGCTDLMACNFDAEATTDDDSCEYADAGYDCDGNCLADSDGDGVCDDFEVPGCMDEPACNFDAEATDDDGSCTYATDTTVPATASPTPMVMGSVTTSKSTAARMRRPATMRTPPQRTTAPASTPLAPAVWMPPLATM